MVADALDRLRIDPTALAECRTLLETAPLSRRLAIAFAPPGRRDALTVLYAFDAELRSLRQRVREPMAGEIRLQWWRDTLSAGARSGAPVADALIELIKSANLPVAIFDRMLEARIFDLYDDPMPSRSDFEGYAGETESSLVMLAGRLLDAPAAEMMADTAGHAGVATAAAGVLADLPAQRARGQCFVPVDLLTAVGASPEALLSGERENGARAVRAMVAFGREHDRAWRTLLPSVPRSVRPALVPASLAANILKRAEARAGAVLNETVSPGPVARAFAPWAMMRA